MKVIDKIGVIFAGIGGVIGMYLGAIDGLVYTLLAFVIADYVTGLTHACINKKLSSAVGLKGIAKKVGIFVLVGLANAIDVNVLGNGSTLRTAVILFYIANEGISLMENWGKMGLPLPGKLRDVLEQLKGKGEGTDEKAEK